MSDKTPMKTVIIQIGNTDEKLTRKEWAAFVLLMKDQILRHCVAVHFFGGSSNWEIWQNVAWVVECRDDRLAALKAEVKSVRSIFDQDSVAWTEGETEFV